MPDPESQRLDHEILAFMHRYRDDPAPEMVFELLALKIFGYQFRRNAS